MIKATYVDHMGSDVTVVNSARVSFGKKSNNTYTTDKDDKLISYLAEANPDDRDLNIDRTKQVPINNPWDPLKSGIIFTICVLVVACTLFQRLDFQGFSGFFPKLDRTCQATCDISIATENRI